MAPPIPPDINNIAQGVKAWIYDLPGHHEWQCVCQFHSGQVVTGTNSDQTPIYSNDVGFQKNCAQCRAQAKLTLDYMHQRYLDAQRSQ
jgi:hypothetical protein